MELNPTSECGLRLSNILGRWMSTCPDVAQDILKRVFLMQAFKIENEDAFVDTLYGQRVLEEPHWDLTKERPAALSRVRHAIGTSLNDRRVEELVVALEWSKNETVLAEILKWAENAGSKQMTETISTRSIDLAPQRAAKSLSSLLSSSGRPVSQRDREMGPDCKSSNFEVCRSCNKIILGFTGGHIRIYSSLDLECQLALPRYSRPSQLGSFQCTCTEIIAIYDDGKLCAWDIKTGILKVETSVQNANRLGGPAHMRWRNHKLVVATSADRIQIWQYVNSSFTLLGGWDTKGDLVSQIEFDEDYVILQIRRDYMSDEDDYYPCIHIHVYTPNGRIKQRIDNPENSMGMAYENGKLVTGGRDGILRIWDVGTGSCLKKLGGHTDVIQCVQVQQNIVCSGDHSGTVIIWDVTGIFGIKADEAVEPEAASAVPPSSTKLVVNKANDDDVYWLFGFGRKFILGTAKSQLRVIDFP